MLVFPKFLTLHMLTLIISPCLPLVVFIVSHISKTNRTPNNPTFPNFTLQYYMNTHMVSFRSGSAIPKNGAIDGLILFQAGLGTGSNVPVSQQCLHKKMLGFVTPGFYSSLQTSVFVGRQTLLPIFSQSAYDLFIFGWFFMATSLTQKPLLFQSSSPYFKAWNWYSFSKEGSSEFKIGKTIYFSQQKSFS